MNKHQPPFDHRNPGQVAWIRFIAALSILALLVLLGVTTSTSPDSSYAQEIATPVSPALSDGTTSAHPQKLSAESNAELLHNGTTEKGSSEPGEPNLSERLSEKTEENQKTASSSEPSAAANNELEVVAKEDRVVLKIGMTAMFRYTVINSTDDQVSADLFTTNSNPDWRSIVDWSDFPEHMGNTIVINPHSKVEIQVVVTAPSEAYQGDSNTTQLIATVADHN